jgi:hypothetical protein
MRQQWFIGALLRELLTIALSYSAHNAYNRHNSEYNYAYYSNKLSFSPTEESPHLENHTHYLIAGSKMLILTEKSSTSLLMQMIMTGVAGIATIGFH